MKIFVAVVGAYNVAGAAAATFYFCSKSGFVSNGASTPADTFFEPRLKQPTVMTRTMFSPGSTMGASRTGYGDLVLDNEDGGLDYLLGYAFDGRDLTVYYGEDTATFPSGFDVVGKGTMTQPALKLRTLTLKTRDRQALLNEPIQGTKYAGTNVLPAGLEGVADDLKGKPKPLCYGVVKNIAPPCVNTSKLIYQVNDGAVDSVDMVYDRGIQLGYSFDDWDYGAAPGSNTRLYDSMWSDDDDLFISVGEETGTGTPIIITSPDGINWTDRTNYSYHPYARYFWAIAYGGGVYVAVGYAQSGSSEGQALIRRSVDGITWTTPTWAAAEGKQFQQLEYGNGIFMAIALTGECYTSPDGTTWTAKTSLGGQTTGLAFGKGYFVAGDSNAAAGDVYKTTDGTTWLGPYPTGSSSTVGPILFQDGLFLAYSSPDLRASFDGITWSLREVAFQDITVKKLAYGVGHFWAVGNLAAPWSGGDALFTSPDGYRWDIHTIALGGFSGDGDSIAINDSVAIIPSRTAVISYTKQVTTYASEADLLDDDLAPAPGTYKYYAAGGYFRLGSHPAGLITADVTQGAAAANRTVGQIWSAGVLTKAGFAAGTGWVAADVTALDTANASVVGLYTGISERTGSSLLTELAQSIGAWWGLDQDALFRIAVLTDPSAGSSSLTFIEDEIVGLERIIATDPGGGLPTYRTVVRYAPNYTIQNTDLAAGVSDARRAEVGKPWRESIVTTASVQTAYILAREQIYETLLATAANAATEATRLQTLRGVRRDRFSFTAEMKATTIALDLGGIVTLQHSRFGLSAGKKFAIISIKPNAEKGTINFEVWG